MKRLIIFGISVVAMSSLVMANMNVGAISGPPENKNSRESRLTDVKLKVCRQRERNITNIMARASDRAIKQIGVFDKISQRVQVFYAEKNLSVDNYEALIAAIDIARSDAESRIDSTKLVALDFKCDGTDPKGTVSSFQLAVKSHNESLKRYKTAIKNLIVAVKSSQQNTNSDQGARQ